MQFPISHPVEWGNATRFRRGGRFRSEREGCNELWGMDASWGHGVVSHPSLLRGECHSGGRVSLCIAHDFCVFDSHSAPASCEHKKPLVISLQLEREAFIRVAFPHSPYFHDIF